jgi:hypothetical protein
MCVSAGTSTTWDKEAEEYLSQSQNPLPFMKLETPLVFTTARKWNLF